MPNALDIEISSATRDDAGTLFRLVTQLAEYEKLSHLVEACEEDFRQALSGEIPAAEAVIARSQGQAVGFALFFHNFSTFLGRRGLYLEDLFVIPEMRSRGVGEHLIRHVAAIAVARNCGRFEWSVLDWNSPAISFYEKLGARILPEWKIVRTTGNALVELAKR